MGIYSQTQTRPRKPLKGKGPFLPFVFSLYKRSLIIKTYIRKNEEKTLNLKRSHINPICQLIWGHNYVGCWRI